MWHENFAGVLFCGLRLQIFADHRCKGHETEALREFLIKFRFQTEHAIPINQFFSSFSFFPAVEDSNFPRFQISGRSHTHRKIQTAWIHFQRFNRLFLLRRVRIVFEFSSHIFSDLFTTFNMLATAITSEHFRQAGHRIRNENTSVLQNKQRWVEKQKKPDSISKLKWKSKPIDFRPMKLPHWISWLNVASCFIFNFNCTVCGVTFHSTYILETST